MPHLFISYAKKDTRKLALELTDKLNEIDGVTAWVDRSLRAGKSWELQIESEIDRCDTLIVLYSPDIHRHKKGKKRSYILNEIAYAQQLDKHLIPIMAQETTPPMALIMEHYIDFTLGNLTVGDLVGVICNELEIAPPQLEIDTPDELDQMELASTIIDIIGKPFEWCQVPAGEFIYSDDENSLYSEYTQSGGRQTLALPSFSIAKYPISYSQFQAFIDDNKGFKDSRWWNDLAANDKHRSKHGNPKWEIPDHPRERVSWYDAVAFCRWLSWRLGGGYDIRKIDDWAVRLPTEFEWEKAARGTDGRLYPWGNKFDENKCNAKASAVKRTTSVTQYSLGASPYGVYNMGGNVWDWCLTDFDNPQIDASMEKISSNSERVLRGGSFFSVTYASRSALRGCASPHLRYFDYGFRIMRPS